MLIIFSYKVKLFKIKRPFNFVKIESVLFHYVVKILWNSFFIDLFLSVTYYYHPLKLHREND